MSFWRLSETYPYQKHILILNQKLELIFWSYAPDILIYGGFQFSNRHRSHEAILHRFRHHEKRARGSLTGYIYHSESNSKSLIKIFITLRLILVFYGSTKWYIPRRSQRKLVSSDLLTSPMIRLMHLSSNAPRGVVGLGGDWSIIGDFLPLE